MNLYFFRFPAPVADSTEIIAMAHALNGLVLLTNCDKITPDMMMAGHYLKRNQIQSEFYIIYRIVCLSVKQRILQIRIVPSETYVKINGKWYYLYRAIDSKGNTPRFMLSAKQDKKAAKRFIKKSFVK